MITKSQHVQTDGDKRLKLLLVNFIGVGGIRSSKECFSFLSLSFFFIFFHSVINFSSVKLGISQISPVNVYQAKLKGEWISLLSVLSIQ